MARPLAGVTVLDLSSVGPAARASRWLADYGAAVVKVTSVQSDNGRQITPPFFAYGAGRGMRRIAIDLKDSRGVEVFLRLAAGADVVLESFRPGVAARLGIGYEQVRKVNENIVYCSISGYGQQGPYSSWAGHDLNYLAIGGFLACSGKGVGGKPALPGTTVADGAAGGMHAVIATTAALFHRQRTGEGTYLDISVTDGVLALMALQLDEHLATGAIPQPGHGLLTGRYACYDLYAAADGKWLSVAAIEPKFWRNLCQALDLTQWVDHQLDEDVQEQIRADLRRVFATRERDDWVRQLSPADTCVAPVLTVPEVVEDSHFLSRGAIGEVRHPQHGYLRQIAPTLAGTAPPDLQAAVLDDEAIEIDELLVAAGFSEADVKALREAGVVA